MVAGAASCRPEPVPPAELRVLDWSGRDGQAVALDQELLIRFDRELRVPVRPSSVRVVDEEGGAHGPFDLEVQGSLLRLRPRLPREAALLDGALPPGIGLRFRLAGIPNLQALASSDGALLRGVQEFGFWTLAANEPSALGGLPNAAGVVHLLDLDEAGVLRLAGSGAPPPTVRFSAGLDPRTLRRPPLLRTEAVSDAGVGRALTARLTVNTPEEALVELDFGDWHGRGILEWPAEWQALGGHPLAEAHRRVRVWRAP